MKPSPYTGFDPLAEADHWEDRDRDLVRSRLHDVPELRFLSDEEARLLDAVVNRLMPQPDRDASSSIPVTPFIDQMLADDDTDGFRKEGMPWDQELWRQALRGIEQTAQIRYGRDFHALEVDAQDDVLAAIQEGRGEGEVWQGLPASAAFAKVLQEVVAVYYAHPSAWAEIGWPGPASKRGYMRTGYGQRDPWQPAERESVSSVQLVATLNGGGSPSGSGGAMH
jgi:hypothetical protein